MLLISGVIGKPHPLPLDGPAYCETEQKESEFKRGAVGATADNLTDTEVTSAKQASPALSSYSDKTPG